MEKFGANDYPQIDLQQNPHRVAKEVCALDHTHTDDHDGN